MKSRLLILVAVGLFTFGISGLAVAVPINFNFSATVDATGFGLSASEAVSIHYTYDPVNTPVYNIMTDIDYGPVNGSLTMGGGTVNINGRVSVRDDTLPGGSADWFSFSAANYVVDTSLGGNINGIPVDYFKLYFLNDSTLDMLNSNELPSSTDFVDGADLMRLHFKHRYTTGAEVLKEFASSDEFSFTSSPVPEPATMLLLGSGLAGLAAVRRKFRKE